MIHLGEKKGKIVSFDLSQSRELFVDVTQYFPLTQLETLDILENHVDNIRNKSLKEIDLSLNQKVMVDSFTDFHTFDIAKREMAHSRGLTRNNHNSLDRYTINLSPPIQIPIDSLDVRDGPIHRKKSYSDLYRRSLPFSLHLRRMVRNTRATLLDYKRPIIAVLIITVGLGIPSLLYVQSLVNGAFKQLSSLDRFSTPTDIIRVVHNARVELERANIIFMPYRYIPEDRIRLARIAIDGGLSLTRGIDTVISNIESGGSGTFIGDAEGGENPFRPTAKDIKPLAFLGISEPTTWMNKNRSQIIYLKNEVRKAGTIFESAEGINHPKSKEIAHIGRGITELARVLDFVLDNEEGIYSLFGATSPERYIIFNQNRDEIRTNGGFPGTVITFTMFKGNIFDYRTDDVYYYDWNLYPFKELPPPGLSLITGTYGLRDVNYYPNFRDTLEKANAFIERSGDPTVTIGVALHQGLIEDILADIGPVTLSGVDIPFTKENFSELMSTLVESRYGEKTSAKDILSEFVVAFISKIHEKRSYEEVLTHVTKYLKEGEILFSSRNPRVESFLSNFKKPLPWEKVEPTILTSISGSTNETEKPRTLFARFQDYINGKKLENPTKIPEASLPLSDNWAYPVFTSLSGNKSDRFIERIYESETSKLNDCQVLNSVTFTHKHTFKREDEEEIEGYLDMIDEEDFNFRKKILGIEGKGKNINYVRLFVPVASVLTGSSAGIEVTATTDYREFSFTLETPVSGSTSKNITYITQVPGCRKTESVSWYRQPGLNRVNFISR